jgi:hypothetical protein
VVGGADGQDGGHRSDAHLVAWATADVKGTRWAVLKNPGALTGDQQVAPASIKKTNDPLYRAYPTKDSSGRSSPSRANPDAGC